MGVDEPDEAEDTDQEYTAASAGGGGQQVDWAQVVDGDVREYGRGGLDRAAARDMVAAVSGEIDPQVRIYRYRPGALTWVRDRVRGEGADYVLEEDPDSVRPETYGLSGAQVDQVEAYAERHRGVTFTRVLGATADDSFLEPRD